MNDAFNFHDTWYVFEANWVWVLAALAVGIWCGWYTSRNGTEKT
jgi:hypothetical protein